MIYKKIVPSIFLKDGAAVAYFNDSKIINESATALALEYSNLGADELIIYDFSNDDASHEKALGVIKEMRRTIDIPMIGAGNIKRLEDVKKLIYAGCKKVALNFSKPGNIELLEESSKRFGKEKIAVSVISEGEVKKNLELVESYSTEIILIMGDFMNSISKVTSLPIIPMANVFSVEGIVDLMGAECVSGVAGTYINIAAKEFMNIKKQCKAKNIAVNTFESSKKWSEFKLNADGLVPVITQDYETGEVLMLAYMNGAAYEKTIETGTMTYYSRSRNELWVKGDTSGHYQYVKSLSADCDTDTILAKVSQIGAACHTGSKSCFFNELIKKEYLRTNPMSVFEDVYAVIKDRKAHPKEGSYTNYLFEKGTDKILKKLGEEATEIVIAAKNPDAEEIKYELSDFLYHAMVLMVDKGITWEDVARELVDR